MRLRKTLVYRKHIIADGIWGLLLIILGLPILIIPAAIAHRYIILSDKAKPLSTMQLDHTKISGDLSSWTLAWRQGLAILNKHYLFPLLITLYLVILLVQQTQLRNLHLTSRYLALNPNFILFLVIASGLGTVYENPILDSYNIKQESLFSYYGYVTLAVGLSLLGTYIIHKQVVELGIIWMLIAVLAGVLIFLVGMMLLEEEEEEEDETPPDK